MSRTQRKDTSPNRSPIAHSSQGNNLTPEGVVSCQTRTGMNGAHVEHELLKTSTETVVDTKYGPIRGGRALNGAATFLEVPYALSPRRFEDPQPLPANFRYEDKAYVRETSYSIQPNNDGQTLGVPIHSRELGKPTEDPLFVNIFCPPAFPSQDAFPVKIFIHGGFLQFGSPHGLGAQAQYVAAERSEVWVNIGYRLSVFGFLACDQPKLDGNYGFKDQWVALQWVRANISSFGGKELGAAATRDLTVLQTGNPEDIHLVGLSAGAHSVHQILHHVSRLPPGEKAPFHCAVLRSNAIITNPKTPSELRPQFHALCRALKLDPNAPDILSSLRDPLKVPGSSITHVIETDVLGIEYGTFRGCLDGVWLSASPDPMTWQRTGELARGLYLKGVRSVVVGDLTEEWYLYSIAHPIHVPSDLIPNLERYYPEQLVKRILGMYPTLSDTAGDAEVQRLFGTILSDGQVYLPTRLLARDLQAAGFPVLRYQIRWAPERDRTEGYVTHATDQSIWAYRIPNLAANEVEVVLAWLDQVAKEVRSLERGDQPPKGVREVLALTEDKTVEWIEDAKWDEIIKLAAILPGEV